VETVPSLDAPGHQGSGITPEDVDNINVHGTSTPLGDISETMADQDCVRQPSASINISSTKSMTGHLLGAAGWQSRPSPQHGLLHRHHSPNINYEFPDPACD